MAKLHKVIYTAIALFAITAGLAFVAVFILLPYYNHNPITPVYATEFSSTMVVQTGEVQENGASISGQIKALKGRPIPALVRLFSAQRSARKLDIVAQSYTDKDGHFSLEVPPGNYEILIYKGPEYEYFLQPLTLPADSALELDISLHQLLDMAALGRPVKIYRTTGRYQGNVLGFPALHASATGLQNHWQR